MISPIPLPRPFGCVERDFCSRHGYRRFVAGRQFARSTEIFHEGIRIAGIKLIEGGTFRKDLFEMIINMTRQPTMVGLDLKCEIRANNVAKSRVQEMFSQYGPS